MYDNEIKDKFVELRAAGKSFGDISQELGVVKSTLHRWEDERADDIARLRRIEWQEQEHRWGRNIEELMTDLACSISDYEMRLRHFTDNLSNLDLRDTVMLLRESRREYFRLRAMLMGTAPRRRSSQKTAPSALRRSMTENSPLPRATETQSPNGVHDRLSDSSDGILSCPVGATTEHGLQRPVTEEQQRGSAKAPEESNETERSQQGAHTQHRNTNDLQQPQPPSFDFPNGRATCPHGAVD